MASVKITELTNLTDPSTTDVMPVVDVDANVTKKVSVGEVVGKITGDVDVATDGTSSIAAGVIVNADVNASAAIAGTKIDPDFGSQTVETTGVFSAAGGAEATPSITFTGDLNTGIYSPGADQVAISSNGVGRVFVDASGRIGIGTTALGTYNANLAVYSAGGGFSSVLHANASGSFPKASAIALGSDAVTYTYSTNGGTVAVTGSAHIAAIQSASSGAGTDIAFINTSSGSVSEKARIDSSGRLLVGTSTSLGQGDLVQIVKSDAGDHFGIYSFDATAGGEGAEINFGRSKSDTKGTGVALAVDDNMGVLNFRGYDGDNYSIAARIAAVADGEFNTSGDTTDSPGRLVFSTTADGASSPTERMRITNGGSVNIGSQGTDVIWNQTAVNGVTLSTAGAIQVARSNDTPVLINRNGNDGTLVVFAQAGIQEGDINVSGTTVSYNGAHLSRWSQLPGGAVREEILRGTVLSNIDEMCEWGEEDNEQLNRMKVSDVEGDRNVSGVFQGWDNDDDIYTDDFYCAMTGDFIIRIAGGVTVQRGDLLMSAGNGTAKPQDDDIIRSKTIAKVTSTHVTCTYDDGSYCVPCVLMAC